MTETGDCANDFKAAGYPNSPQCEMKRTVGRNTRPFEVVTNRSAAAVSHSGDAASGFETSKLEKISEPLSLAVRMQVPIEEYDQQDRPNEVCLKLVPMPKADLVPAAPISVSCIEIKDGSSGRQSLSSGSLALDVPAVSSARNVVKDFLATQESEQSYPYSRQYLSQREGKTDTENTVYLRHDLRELFRKSEANPCSQDASRDSKLLATAADIMHQEHFENEPLWGHTGRGVPIQWADDYDTFRKSDWSENFMRFASGAS